MAALRHSKRLRLKSGALRREHVLAVSGELDMLAAPALEAEVRRLCDAGARAMLIDLSELTFADSRGLQATLKIQKLCREHRCELCLIPAPSRVQSLFEMTGLAESLPFSRAKNRVGLTPDAILPKLFAPAGPSGKDEH